MTDSEQVPRGKGEKNPGEGSETDLKSCVYKLWKRRSATQPFAFCIMSPRVNLAGKANRKGSRSESESEQGDLVGRIGPEAHVSYPWTA